jgi:hypothetical protein
MDASVRDLCCQRKLLIPEIPDLADAFADYLPLYTSSYLVILLT